MATDVATSQVKHCVCFDNHWIFRFKQLVVKLKVFADLKLLGKVLRADGSICIVSFLFRLQNSFVSERITAVQADPTRRQRTSPQVATDSVRWIFER
mmetsp:Transcript_40360/g.108290  ORF Transcript_40360/g.108290 Transcript_40360/m.108290 type:complete len:97 (+) Transcript_40360:1570-1860(+)